MKRFGRLATGILLTLPIAVSAQQVRITPDTIESKITLNTGKTLVIERIQDTSHHLTGDFTKTSRACPPFCIHSMSAAEGVETVGELEVISFLKETVAKGNGLLLDSRVPEWHAKGAIPGSINLPFSALDSSNPYRDEILKALGARAAGSDWDFSEAKDLMLYCNGPWCDQSPRAIRSLREAGYPADKIKYYRGGMQVWLLLGLSTETPSS